MNAESTVARGQAFEDELAKDVVQSLGGYAERDPSSGSTWQRPSDLKCSRNLMARFNVEAKDHERLNLEAAFAQAIRRSFGGSTPIAVVRHGRRDEAMVYCRWRDFLNLLAEMQDAGVRE